MNEIQLQTKVLTKTEMPLAAQTVADNLLETYSGSESYVLVKSAMETLAQALDILKEKAIKSVHGKEEIIMGAKVVLKMSARKYAYSGTEYQRLFEELSEAKRKFKNHTDILEISESGWINPNTGETELATMISGEGTTINVTFNK